MSSAINTSARWRDLAVMSIDITRLADALARLEYTYYEDYHIKPHPQGIFKHGFLEPVMVPGKKYLVELTAPPATRKRFGFVQQRLENYICVAVDTDSFEYVEPGRLDLPFPDYVVKNIIQPDNLSSAFVDLGTGNAKFPQIIQKNTRVFTETLFSHDRLIIPGYIDKTPRMAYRATRMLLAVLMESLINSLEVPLGQDLATIDEEFESTLTESDRVRIRLDFHKIFESYTGKKMCDFCDAVVGNYNTHLFRVNIKDGCILITKGVSHYEFLWLEERERLELQSDN